MMCGVCMWKPCDKLRQIENFTKLRTRKSVNCIDDAQKHTSVDTQNPELFIGLKRRGCKI